MTELLEFPTVTATDMTLMLGAESYIRHRQSVYNDPWSKDCLRDFVDLLLNSEQMYFTLPGKKNKGVPALVRELTGLLHKLPDAAIHLTPEIEENILNGFINLATRQSEAWLWDWLRFQLVNPIVTDGHRVRVCSMKPGQEHEAQVDSMVSSDGYEIWKSNLSKVTGLGLMNNVPPIEIRRYLASYLKSTKHKFTSEKEFFLCYAFDVYRRGWQYISRVSAADIGATYFPHQIRNDALEKSTNKWEIVHQNQKLLWSWGEYIVGLINEYKIERSPEKVAEYVVKIHEAMKDTKCPKWFNIGVLDGDDPFKDVIQQTITETAKKARLPILRMREDPEAVEWIEAIIGMAFDIIGLPILSGAKLVRLFVKRVSPNFIGKVDVNIEDGRRRAV